MAISFKELKKNNSSAFQKLQQEVDKQKKFHKSEDERLWQPTIDKEGNGSAIIRFLPAAEGEEVPFVRMFSHGFKGPTGKWYIENSRTTIGDPDPMSELNSKLWNSTTDEDSIARKMARDQKRKLSYTSNIYIVRDGGNPDNEGKVFLYRYGVKIWDKINTAMHPDESFGDKPINPFDLWTGANFRLKICKVKGYRNYDNSVFESSTPLSDDDSALEKIWAKCYPLLPLAAHDQFKSYDELQKQIRVVLGNSADFVLEGVGEGEARSERKETERKEPAHTASRLADEVNGDDVSGEVEDEQAESDNGSSPASVKSYFDNL